jgi:Uma2 family endonuclease
MQVETLHRFSVSDYYRMAETGVLDPDARVELLDGQIIDMSPIGPFHGGVVKRLNRLFTRMAKGRWIVAVQDPTHVDDYSEPQPDLMLLKPSPDDYTSGHPGPEDVYLLIEVADSSLAKDREKKLPIYGRAGVPEVWVVNLVEETIEVYREPNFTGYGSRQVLSGRDTARVAAFLDVAVDVGGLLRR